MYIMDASCSLLPCCFIILFEDLYNSTTAISFSVGQLCGNWDTDAVVGHWVVAGKCLCIIFGVICYFTKYLFSITYGLCELQYLKHVRPFREVPIFERFPVLICIAIIWIYSLILTASGAYRGKPSKTQISCRTDRADLISTAPWYLNWLTSASLMLCCVLGCF